MDGFIGFVSVALQSYILLAVIFAICLFYSSSSDKGENLWWYTSTCLLLFWMIVDKAPFTQFQLYVLGVCWVPIGIIWVLVKWLLRVKKVKYQVANSDNLAYFDFTKHKESIEVDKQKSVIALWFIFWPVSMISTFTVDIINTIEYLIVVQFGSVFKKISSDAIADLEAKQASRNSNSCGGRK